MGSDDAGMRCCSALTARWRLAGSVGEVAESFVFAIEPVTFS